MLEIPAGEMARLIREHDWAATPLGPMAAWPRSLATVVDLLLAHPMPSIVLWGPDLIQVYNDAYARMTGAEPPAASLGRPARESWLGAWEVSAPFYERVFLRGESLLLEEHPFPIDRRGRREDGHFTVSYSPARGDGGRVAGIFMTVIETTAKVRAEAALRASEGRQAFLLCLGDSLRAQPDEQSIKERTVEMLAEHLRLDRCWISEVFAWQGLSTVGPEQVRPDLPPMSGVYRLSDYPETMRQLATQPMAIDDVASDPRFSASGKVLLDGLRLRALLVAPLRKGHEEVIWALAAAMATPRPWAEGERVLLEEVGERAWAAIERARVEEALRRSEGRLRLALDAARMGTWGWDVAGDSHRRDASLNALLGLPAEETVRPLAEFLGQVHPDDRPAVRAAFDRSVRQGRPLNAEFRVVRPDGEVRWLQDQGDVFGTADQPWMTGACVDVTEMKQAEVALRASEGLLRAVAAHLPNAAVFVVDPNLRYTLAEGHALRAAGFAPSHLEGRSVAEALGRELAVEYEPNFRRALAGEEFSVEHSSHGRHFATHLAPLPGPGGRPAAALAVSYDITDRVRAEEEVRRARDGLEARVAERTADLHAEVERRRDLARRLGTAQEDERRRVSRDLHDSVGQLLAALPIALRMVEEAGPLPAPAAVRLAEARRLVDAVGREVHALAVRLRPTALDDLGLEAALDLLVAEWSARSGVSADFLASGLGPGRLPPEVETAVYRVVQEALTNVAKHARATLASVVVGRPDGHVTAVVEDDGAGFDTNKAPGGRLGVVGMRERIALVGGQLEIESRPGEGTAVVVRIPLSKHGGS